MTIDYADLRDDQMIRKVEARMRDREARQAQEAQEARDRVRQEDLRKQQLEQEKLWAEARAAETARQREESQRQRETFVNDPTKRPRNVYEYLGDSSDNDYDSSDYDSVDDDDGSAPSTSIATCSHRGRWDKVRGRKACPDCGDAWNYLLQCKGCRKAACPKCQRALRPNYSRR